MYSIPSSARDLVLSMVGRTPNRGGESGKPDPGNAAIGESSLSAATCGGG